MVRLRSAFIIPAIGAALCVSTAKAQTFKGISDDSLRNGILKSVASKLKKQHYSPKQLNDNFSNQVWDRFMASLDPARNIFLKEDIAKLDKFRNQIDEEISQPSTAFFDAAYAIYVTRMQETSKLVEQLLSKPIDLTKNEVYNTDRSKAEYPATKSEREKLWLSYLKYSVVRNYYTLEAAAGGNKSGAKTDEALDKKAREKVGNWYKKYFLKNTNDKSRNEKFAVYMNTITLEMDPHTMYTFPNTTDKLNIRQGAFFGIGVELGVEDADVYVKRMVPEGSAYKSGLMKEKDRILAIADQDGKMQSTAAMEADEIAGMVRGAKGTSVKMIVQQPGAAEREVSIPRAEISDNPNLAKSAVVINNGKKIGYIFLPMFYVKSDDPNVPGCSADIAQEVEKLKDENVDGIVLDLRGNGGGALMECVRMGENFIPSSAITFLKAKDSITPFTSPVVTAPRFSGPLAILIDEGSASASEMYSAAMQDHRRALVIGTSSSFGKGTAQQSMNMGKMGDASKGIPDVSYGSIRLTVQKFYRVNGATTQLKGVIPDVVLTEKNNLSLQREQDLPAALASDSLPLNGYQQNFQKWNYALVKSKAIARVKNNAALQQLNGNMEALKKLQQAPTPISLAAYRAQQQQAQQYEKAIQDGKSMQNNTLQMKASEWTRYSPDFNKRTESQEKIYQEWLQKLSKDLFLSEAVNLVQDMIDNPSK
ncbi:carboxy terminal-processing peptidase [Pseudoflavitalea sp. G-6-1-2]|uniref:carboxy terminal-processing peptidase n=1 Tax=Pseudoflavitalea sp. G-6-1-2 TaxID=2728841 RepID=UPI00146B4A25|nr:carboxy terminal-processing peptidase [Pseudoflavitalea sp. G-6-1-2]NML21644.1 carboxy terminal-processing peptidase [Pseudoflavitalea sp. G-6-1-2]